MSAAIAAVWQLLGALALVCLASCAVVGLFCLYAEGYRWHLRGVARVRAAEARRARLAKVPDIAPPQCSAAHKMADELRSHGCSLPSPHFDDDHRCTSCGACWRVNDMQRHLWRMATSLQSFVGVTYTQPLAHFTVEPDGTTRQLHLIDESQRGDTR